MVNENSTQSRRSSLYAQSMPQVHYPARETMDQEYNTCQKENGVLQAHWGMECRRTSTKSTFQREGDSNHSVINSGVSGYWMPTITCQQDMRDWAPVADIGYWNTRQLTPPQLRRPRYPETTQVVGKESTKDRYGTCKQESINCSKTKAHHIYDGKVEVEERSNEMK